jgi:hypothetical protein
MAVKQVFGNSYEYVCIDNVSAPSFPTLSDKTSIGYDSVSVVPNFGAAVGQGANAIATGTNGTIPDYVVKQTAIATGQILVSLGYKNPS